MMNTNQYLSDKIKAARTSDDLTGWLTFGERRLKITTDPSFIENLNRSIHTYESFEAFIRSKKGIVLEWIGRHDGGRFRTRNARYLNDSDVMAVVIQHHDR